MAQLAVVLAHRLRGLVASIEGFTDLLNDTLQDAEQRDLAMKIMEGTARIESVLADLQLYGEHFDPVMLPIRVEEVLRDLFVPLEGDSKKKVAVETPAEAADKMLDGDPYLLRQALLILVQNAIEADTDGGRARLTVDATGQKVTFEVWNHGTIELEDAEELVFTPFFTTKAHNLGVGLSIARRIARLHDANLELAVNEPDRGTCFTLTVPVSGPSRN